MSILSGGVRLGLLLLLLLPLSAPAVLAQTTTDQYAPNVIASQTTNSTVTNGTITVNDTSNTGVSVSATGLTGVSNATVTTQSLSSPSTGVPTFTTSGSSLYFDVSITLPPGVTAPPDATTRVCFTDPSVTAGDTLEYWDGSTWVAADDVTITGTQICGTVPLSVLTGTNFALARPPSPSLLPYLEVAVVVIVVILVAFLLIRRRKPAQKSQQS